MSTRTAVLFLLILAALMVAGGRIASVGEGGGASSGLTRRPTSGGEDLTSRAEIVRLVRFNREIELSPEQEAVRREALEGLAAPCCSDFSAATCCCECNLARATWGLAKHLIKNEEYGVADVRAAVADWYRALNTDGFSGKACFSGGCDRQFRHDGCGGMEEGELVF